MKKIFFSILVLVIVNSTFAQKKAIEISAGPTTDLNFNIYYKHSIGASVKARYTVSKLGAIIGDITWLVQKPKSSTPVIISSLNMLNIKFGYLSYINNSHFFIQADAGISHYSYKDNKAAAQTGFIGGFGVGYSFVINSKSSIDIAPNLNYLSQDGTGWLIINLGYRIKLNQGSSKK